ncbi:hypothetical protein RB195_025239 [Necator americanus]|uniref:Endonuclease/exonuclease/phosphatase domain-containing protein n=1 Tax=Necator americanus TaxID=51031 RepID=A0ABR1ERF3_NECAM
MSLMRTDAIAGAGAGAPILFTFVFGEGNPFTLDEARTSPKSNAHRLRPGNVTNMRGLTARGRCRPKKLIRHRQQHPARLAPLNETRWKGSKSRELGDGYKLIYHGTSNRNVVGVILNETFGTSVTAVDRLSDRLMAVKVDTGEVELRVVSAYAPQAGAGCSEEEKACFWEDLEQYVQSLEGEEVFLIGGDFNRHVGSREDARLRSDKEHPKESRISKNPELFGTLLSTLAAIQFFSALRYGPTRGTEETLQGKRSGDYNQEKRLRGKLHRQLQQDRDSERRERRSLKRLLNTAGGKAVGETTLPIWRDHFKTLLNRQALSARKLERVHRPTYAVNEEPPSELEILV